MISNGFWVDLDKCTGCDACRLACTIENGLAWDRSWREVLTFNERRHPALPVYHLSIACNHCQDPPCVTSCPARAYERDERIGAVLIDGDRCIGCRYCSWACPYDAPRYDRERGVMEKCTFCRTRLLDGRDPACVALCPTGALRCRVIDTESGSGSPARAANGGGWRSSHRHGEEARRVSDSARPVLESVPGFPDVGIGPRIRFTGKREAPSEEPVRPAGAPPDNGPSFVPAGTTGRGRTKKIALREVWPLVAFTLIAAVLVASLAASLVSRPGHGPSPPASISPYPVRPIALLGLAGLGLGLSTLHLGRKRRAWRAVLNLRHSWLSREVFLFGAFVALAGAYTVARQSNGGWGSLAAAVGFTALFSMDRVYEVVSLRPRFPLHSAHVTLVGLFLLGLGASDPRVAGTVGLVRFALYGARKIQFARDGEPHRPWLTAPRLLFGFLVPAVLWARHAEALRPGVLGTEDALLLTASFVGVALGEIIDRVEYYLELDVLTPRRQIDRDVGEMILRRESEASRGRR